MIATYHTSYSKPDEQTNSTVAGGHLQVQQWLEQMGVDLVVCQSWMAGNQEVFKTWCLQPPATASQQAEHAMEAAEESGTDAVFTTLVAAADESATGKLPVGSSDEDTGTGVSAASLSNADSDTKQT